MDQKCQVVPPRTSDYTFASIPPGAAITYIDEEKEVLAPYVAQPIVGSRQAISAASVMHGRSFVQWSDGLKTPTRSFLVGAQPTTFTALYVNKPPNARVGQVRVRGVKPRTLTLDATRSDDPEGEPLRFTWSFSDKKIVRGPKVSRTFKRAGTYRVSLIVRDRLGASAVYRAMVRVTTKSVSLRQATIGGRLSMMESSLQDE